MTKRIKHLGILLLFISFYGNAQDTKLPDPEAFFSAIIVADIDTSIEWYENVFGFQLLNKVESKERGFSQSNLKRGNVLLELIQLNSAAASSELLKNQPEKNRVQGFFKFGLVVTKFDAWVNYLKEAKVSFRGDVVTDSVSGKKMLIILDPDGNRIQLFEK